MRYEKAQSDPVFSTLIVVILIIVVIIGFAIATQFSGSEPQFLTEATQAIPEEVFILPETEAVPFIVPTVELQIPELLTTVEIAPHDQKAEWIRITDPVTLDNGNVRLMVNSQGQLEVVTDGVTTIYNCPLPATEIPRGTMLLKIRCLTVDPWDYQWKVLPGSQ